MKLENYYLLTLLTSQGCWKRTRKEAEFGSRKWSLKLENYYLLTLLTSQGCWKRTRKEAEARGVEKYIQDLQHRFTFSENYYLLTRLPGLLEENKERSKIWKQKMEFETQKKWKTITC